jgi:uncharacterized membrane protein YqjE
LKSSVYIAEGTGDMLKDTLSKFFKIDSIIENLTGLVETRVELLKVEVKEDVSKGLAQAVAYLFIAFILALFVTFVSIALAFAIGEKLGTFAGFSIVGVFYLIIGLILWFFREKLIAKLENTFAIMFRKKN